MICVPLVYFPNSQIEAVFARVALRMQDNFDQPNRITSTADNPEDINSNQSALLTSVNWL